MYALRRECPGGAGTKRLEAALLIFVDRTSKQYYCPTVKLRLSCLPVPCHSKEQAIKKFIEALSVVVVVAGALMLLASPGYSFRGGGSPGYHGGYGYHGGPWWRGAAAWPYYRGACGCPCCGYAYYAGYP